MERGLAKLGRAEIPGRPLLYERRNFFSIIFGLRNLDDYRTRGIADPPSVGEPASTRQL